mmetsp:Transcript_9245/g.16309  ORF Transcript_9245/g.16309 Transcript_9245/m.16309 type:complete len:521 (-) Transcript_9245:74-1636(-)
MKDSSGSWIICDSLTKGCPIKYTSEGFQDLFGYHADECAGRNCSELIGGQSLLDTCNEALHRAAEDAGLSDTEATAGVRVMQRAAAKAVAQMQFTECGKLGDSVLLLNRRKSGDLFVCEMAVCRKRHPSLEWSYEIGVQQDITQELSVPRLLQVAAKSEHDYDAFSEAWRSSHSSFTRNMQQKLDTSSQYHDGAAQMWRDAVTKGVKSTEYKKSRPDDVRSVSSLSTTCSLNSTKEASQEGNPAHFHLAGVLEALSEEPATRESQRFLDLLELPEGIEDSDFGEAAELQPSEDEAWQSFSSEGEEQRVERLSLEEAVDAVSRPSLRSLSCSLVIAGPSQPGFPVLCCSRGFQELTGFAESEMVGRDLRSLFGNLSICTLRGFTVNSNWRSFCDFAVTGRYYRGSDGGGSAVLADGIAAIRLQEGELAFMQDFESKSRRLFSCLVYLKQVELDDCPHVAVMQVELPREVAAQQLQDSFQQLNVQLDEAIGVMASEFFYHAPMRRQIAGSPPVEECLPPGPL